MMSAWRSLLGRSHHLLLSRLRPVHRRARQFGTILGRSNLIGSGGYASSSNGDCQAEVNRQHPAAQETSKRHLYVVLDDHKDSYGIHKLDMEDDNDDLEGGHASSPRRLPVLPVLSAALETFSKGTKFAAVGSSIVAIGCEPEPDDCGEDEGRVLIYDTEQAEMVVSHQLPEGLVYGYKIAMAVGQRLYILESNSWLSSHNNDPGQRKRGWIYPGGLHCLAAGPDVGEGNEFWQWRPLSPSSRWSWSEDDRLLGIPFCAGEITACAVHVPPGSVAMRHDIYVSAQYDPFGDTGATFSFSTASGEWTQRGEWLLPVIGHAHYDSQLDAWLGLHAVAGDGPRLIDGHLCAGDIASDPKEWEVGEEKLFCRDEDTAAGWRHVDAKLVPMGPGVGGNEYCLMERLRQEGDDEECWGDGDKWQLRLTVFRVERGQDGEPVFTARHPARRYKMSRYNKYFDAQAFWM